MLTTKCQGRTTEEAIDDSPNLIKNQTLDFNEIDDSPFPDIKTFHVYVCVRIVLLKIEYYIHVIESV